MEMQSYLQVPVRSALQGFSQMKPQNKDRTDPSDSLGKAPKASPTSSSKLRLLCVPIHPGALTGYSKPSPPTMAGRATTIWRNFHWQTIGLFRFYPKYPPDTSPYPYNKARPTPTPYRTDQALNC